MRIQLVSGRDKQFGEIPRLRVREAEVPPVHHQSPPVAIHTLGSREPTTLLHPEHPRSVAPVRRIRFPGQKPCDPFAMSCIA